MRLAYIVIAHRLPDQLLRLVQRLVADDTTIMIHIDKHAARGVFGRFVRGTRGLSNVHLLARSPCQWGGYGHVRATLTGIDELLGRDISFDHAILLTGQDYPIKTNGQIADFFDRNAGGSFMSYFALPSQEWADGGLPRFERWHVRRFGRHVAVPLRRRIPQRLRPFGGSSYWCLTRDCVEYIARFTGRNRSFVDFFKHVDIPDELIFQTLLMNSPLAPTIVNDDMRYINWKDEDVSSPSVLGVHDFPELARSTKLFARKFDTQVDVEILDRIDREILDSDYDRT